MSTLRERICKIEGCIEPHRSKGYCSFHYERHLKGRIVDAPSYYISTEGPCLVGECDKPRRSRGLCANHYEQARNRAQCPVCGGPRRSKSVLCAACSVEATKAHLPTERFCRGCERTLPIDAFGIRTSGQGSAKWRSRCKECESADSKIRVQNARLRAKAEGQTYRKKGSFGLYSPLRSYAKKLGIPWAEVVDRYPADNRCEICGRTPQEANPGGRFERLSLDHCHETGALRGFLCGPCNTGVGHLGDTPERLQTALEYLLRHYSPEAATVYRRRKRVTVQPDNVIALF